MVRRTNDFSLVLKVQKVSPTQFFILKSFKQERKKKSMKGKYNEYPHTFHLDLTTAIILLHLLSLSHSTVF